MSISISGSTAISGLSGMDTNFDTVLEQLYTVEKTQLNQLESWKADWQLRYDAFNGVIDQMSAAKQMLSNIGSVNNFVTKTAVSTDEKVLTALASGSAANGQHKIKVDAMASNAIWCNTGHVFEEKTDIINKTGQKVDFTFDYAGKSYTYEIAPNTTLESFVSMINNSSKNPGVQVSVINTGNGYVFQIAGRSTGEANSLTVYSCGLEGMDVTNATSLWSSDSLIDPTAAITNPTAYTYTATLNSGTKVSVNIKGDSTIDELVTAFNTAAGADLINASKDASGNLVVGGVRSITRKSQASADYTPSGYKLNVNNLNSPLVENAQDTDTLSVSMTLVLDDSTNPPQTTTRQFNISASATSQQFVDQVKQALGSSARLGLNSQGSYEINFDNVSDISIINSSSNPVTLANISGSTYAASGTSDSLSTSIVTAQTNLTFDNAKLNSRIDGKAADEAAESLRYTLVDNNGDAIYVDIKSDKTNSELYDAIKAALNNAPSASQITFSESTNDSGDKLLNISGLKDIFLSTGPNGTSGFTTKFDHTSQINATSFYSTTDDNGNPIQLIEEAPDLNYKIVLNDGTVITTEDSPIPSGSSLETVISVLQNKLSGTNAQISLKDSEGNDWTSASQGNAYLQVSNVQSFTGAGILGQVISSSNWNITNASNAIYQVDNWPMIMESSSNTISDLLEGVSITLQGTGESNLTISTDVSSVETSIQNFLDAVNSVLLTIREYTKVDDSKEVTSNDPNDAGKSNYSKSTLTAEKGGLLTGNYGVQLVKSRFMSVVTSTPPGFQAMTSADDLLSGDILSCLSNMGIKTDTDSTSETYGLLVIAPRSDFLQMMDSENYDDMLNNHINELVEFFVSEGTGTSTSADFRYNSHIAGITEAGTYDVAYDVDANGRISNVTVGGEPCIRDESRGGYYFTCSSGAARGLAISIDDLTEGSHSGKIRIKQGLVQTVRSFLEKELKFNDVNISANAPDEILAAQISMKSENGAIMTLKNNYATIMENIDKSINNEQRRLDTWYNRQKNIFSNLETLLRELNSQQEALESQLGQLGGS